MSQIPTASPPHSAARTGPEARPKAATRAPTPRPAGPGLQHDAAAMLLRLSLGGVMLIHGAQKVLGVFGGPGFSGTIDMFESAWGVPAAAAVLVMVAEFLGSLGLLFGLFTRLSALGIAAVMVGAVVLVHWQHGFFMNWTGQQAGEGYEYHLLAIGAALAVVALGGGRWSLDRRVRSWWRRRRDAPLDGGVEEASAEAFDMPPRA